MGAENYHLDSELLEVITIIQIFSILIKDNMKCFLCYGINIYHII